MKIKCKLGFHFWVRCSCLECGKIRDINHTWLADCAKCPTCGKNRGGQHDWEKDCEKCFKCGKTRENQHDLTKDCQKCTKCGKTIENQHIWDSCICTRCGKSKSFREQGHNWYNCKCIKCGTIGELGHDFKNGKCLICGKVQLLDDASDSDIVRELQTLKSKLFELPNQFPRGGRIFGSGLGTVQGQIPIICRNIDDSIKALNSGLDSNNWPITKFQIGNGLISLVDVTKKPAFIGLMSTLLSIVGIEILEKYLYELEQIAKHISLE